MKRLVVIAVVATFVFGAYLSFSTVDSKAPVAIAAGNTYSGTVYVAGMGGHFAKADVTIDPSNADEPIKVNNLDRVVIGRQGTIRPMIARIDVNDRNIDVLVNLCS